MKEILFSFFRGVGAKGRGEKEPQAGSMPSMEAGAGLEPTSLRTWPELKSKSRTLN